MVLMFQIEKQTLQQILNILSGIDSGKIFQHNGKNFVVAQTFLQVLNLINSNSFEINQDLIEHILLIIGKLPCETPITENDGKQMCDLYCELRTTYYSVIGKAYYGTNDETDND